MIIDYNKFIKRYELVSRETCSQIETYLMLLIKWNKKINLFSRALDQEILFEKLLNDSLGLTLYINNKNSKILDIGSGNGFPGIILAILGFDVSLIEIKTKKTVFLQEVVSTLKLNSKIYNKDVRLLEEKSFDIITAKAFSSLRNIVTWTQNIYSENTKYLLLKSFNNDEEIMKLNKLNISLELQVYKNTYNSNSAIIELKNIKFNEKN